jgi:hypothetical protein
MNLDFSKPEHLNVLLTAIGIGVNCIAILFVWLQLRQNHRLERASFTNTLNSELNQFIDARVLLKTCNTKEKVQNLSDENYERILDYLTSFENIRWMVNQKVLTIVEAKDFFGGRFYEAFYSVFFQTKCEEDKDFKLMYRMIFELDVKFTKSSLKIGYAKNNIPIEQSNETEQKMIKKASRKK